MRQSSFNRFVASFTIFCFFLTTFMQPITAVAGTSIWVKNASGETTSWAKHSSGDNACSFSMNTLTYQGSCLNWVNMPNLVGYGKYELLGGGVVKELRWPKDNFERIASMEWERDPETPEKQELRWKIRDAEKWIRYGREDVGRLGIRSDQMSNVMNKFPSNAAYVFASYSVETKELIIEVQKVEKNPHGIVGVYRADFTPWHGEFNKWKRDYLTDDEMLDKTMVGHNPFEKFKGKLSNGAPNLQDGVFHNIGWEAVGVAVGEAMKRYNAHMGWIATDKTRLTYKKKKSGGAFKKKVTIYIDGYAKPQWFVATPLGVQPSGGMSAICLTELVPKLDENGEQEVDDEGNLMKTCDAPEHTAISGIAVQAWEGGNMDELEEKIYAYKKSKSGFTMLTFAILTFAFTWGVMSAMSAVAGTGSAVGAGAASSSFTPLTAGALSSGMYAGFNMLKGTGFTTTQQNWGFSGDRGDGVDEYLKPNDEHQRRLDKAIQNVQVNSRFGTGLTGVKRHYSGNCEINKLSRECAAEGKSTGIMHRPDNYKEVNTPLMLIARKEKCVEAVPQEDWNRASEDEVFKEALRKSIQQCTAGKLEELSPDGE